jgi:hypothetical protein
MTLKEIRVECGHRHSLGTDWPVVCLVKRSLTGSRPWLLTFGVCNGIAEGGIACPTRRLALELAEAYKAGVLHWRHAIERLLHGYGGTAGRCKWV